MQKAPLFFQASGVRKFHISGIFVGKRQTVVFADGCSCERLKLFYRKS